MNYVPCLWNYKYLKAREQYLETFTARISNYILMTKKCWGQKVRNFFRIMKISSSGENKLRFSAL